MHILMVGAGNPNSTFIKRQIQSLQVKGIEVSLMPSFSRNQYLNKKLLNMGFTFHISQNIKSAIRQADIIHFQWPGHWMTFGPLAKKYNKPSVLSLRGQQINILPYVPGYEKYRMQLQKSLTECNAYHCVSKAMVEEARLLGLIDENRAFIIRPAVDPEFFAPANSELIEYPLKLIMIGALIWRKGYDYALLGVKQAKEQGLNISLTIIGDGEDRKRIEYMIRELDLENEVQLLGRKKPEEVRDLMQASHVLLHTSLSEGIANVILEAMACELAVITTAAGGIDEVITDGENGLLIPVRDPSAVASRIAQVSANLPLRTKLGKKARKDVLEKHTLEQQAGAFYQMYSQILDQG